MTAAVGSPTNWAEHAPRDGVVDVHRALRALLHRVRGQRLTALERQVLDGVIELTVTWCRLSDRVTVGQVGDVSGVARERTVREILVRLAGRGLIVWEPVRGRPTRGGTRSLIGLLPADVQDVAAPAPVSEIRRKDEEAAPVSEIRRKDEEAAPDSTPAAFDEGAEIRRSDEGLAPDYRDPAPEIRRSGHGGGAEIRRFSRCTAPSPTGAGSSLREEPPPAPACGPAREAPTGGGDHQPMPGSRPGSDSGPVPVAAAADEVLAAVAHRLDMPVGSLRLQRARVAEVLAAGGGWTSDALRGHLLDELPFPIRHPPALIGRRLHPATLPAGPDTCPCRACRRTVAASRRAAERTTSAGLASTWGPRRPVDRDRLRATLTTCGDDGLQAALDGLAAALGPQRHAAVLRRLSPFPGRRIDDPITVAATRPLLVARADACRWDPQAFADSVLGDLPADAPGAGAALCGAAL